MHEPDKHGVIRCDVFWAGGIYRFPFKEGETPTLEYIPYPELTEGTLRIPDDYELPKEEYLATVKLALDLMDGTAEKQKQEVFQNLIEKLRVDSEG